MSRDLNKAMLTGYVEAAPVLSRTDGKPVTKFLLASQRPSRGGAGETEWIPCVAQDRLAELICRHARAGSRLYVEGRVRTRCEAGADTEQLATVEIVLMDIIFLGGDRSRGGARSSVVIDEDQVPFGYNRDDDY